MKQFERHNQRLTEIKWPLETQAEDTKGIFKLISR